MGVVIGFVWLVIGYVLMQTSIQVWTALMLPNPVERARQRIVRKPYASFFVGLAFWGASVALGVNLIKIPGAGSLIGYAVMAPMFAASVVGGGALSRIIGERIKKYQRNESGITALIGGAFITTLAGLLPVIGWFMFLPLTGFIAIGAGALGVVNKRRVEEEEPAPAAAPVYPATPAEDPHAAWTGYPAPQAAAAPAQSWSRYPAQPEQR